MRLRIVALGALVVSTLMLLAGCGSSTSTHTTVTSAGAGAATATSSATIPGPHGASTVTLQVPKANASGPLATPHTLTVPAGWSVQAWARVPAARYELWTPQHDLLVSSSSTGRVTELIPGASASAVPRQRVLASGLNEPQGMAFDTFKGATVLYIAEDDELNRYVWKADGTLGARTILVKNLLDPRNPGNHFAKSLAIGPDHTIYMTGGSAANVGTADLHTTPERAVIYTVDPATDKLGIYATGIRNGEGLAFAPDGTLWTAVNERDNIAYPFHKAYGGVADAYGKVMQSYVTDHPPDEVTRLTKGINLGWPYCDPDPDVDKGAVNSPLQYADLSFDADAQMNPGSKYLNCAKLAPIKRGLPAHSAPVSLTFLEGSSVAAPWRNGALIGIHGSWDAKPQRAPAILWLPWNGSTRTLGAPVTLIGGFQLNAAGNRWGRTVDAIPGAGGELYVSDDTSGTIYRVGPAH